MAKPVPGVDRPFVADDMLPVPTLVDAVARLRRIKAGESMRTVYEFAKPLHVLAMNWDQRIVVDEYLKTTNAAKPQKANRV